MSQEYKNEFVRIQREYLFVTRLLSNFLTNRSQNIPGFPNLDLDLIESAKITTDDSYALLLMTKSEGFMRTYLSTINISFDKEPSLGVLIDRCVKEFNMRNTPSQIYPNTVSQMQKLREQRNSYAHGHGRNLFSDISTMVRILGRFFEPLP